MDRAVSARVVAGVVAAGVRSPRVAAKGVSAGVRSAGAAFDGCCKCVLERIASKKTPLLQGAVVASFAEMERATLVDDMSAVFRFL